VAARGKPYRESREYNPDRPQDGSVDFRSAWSFGSAQFDAPTSNSGSTSDVPLEPQSAFRPTSDRRVAKVAATFTRNAGEVKATNPTQEDITTEKETRKKISKYEADLRRNAKGLQNLQLVINLLNCTSNIASGAAEKGGYLEKEMNHAIIYRQEVLRRMKRVPKTANRRRTRRAK
jgi:hypothetical protein